ncbi:MAG: ABC transporter ATP-binding protein [Oligoflexales bacterium]
MQDPVLKLLFKLLSQQKKTILFSFFCLLWMALGHGALLTLMGPFVQSLTGQNSEVPAWTQWLFKNQKTSWSLQIPFALIFAGIIKSTGSYGYQWLSSSIAIQTTSLYRTQLFKGLLSCDFEDIQKKSPGTWMSILMTDAQVLQKQVVESLSASVRDSILILASWTTLAYVHPASALSLLLIGPILASIMGVVGNKISYFADNYQRLMSELAAIFFDQRQRFDMIRSQHAEQNELKRFHNKNMQHFHYVKKSIFIRASFAPVLEWFGFGIFAGWIWYIQSSKNPPLQGQDLVLFFAALGSMLRPLKGLGEQVGKIQEVRGVLSHGRSLITQKETLKTKPVKSTVFPTHITSITLERLQFSLKLQDLKLSPRTVAVIGRSGSGKSTFARILAHLIKPTLWDSQLLWEDFCTQVTMVSQKPFLFQGSLYENLIYGLNYTPSQEDMDHVLWVVDMKDHIDSLADGLQTYITALSTNFSGGQKQRLTLARGLLSRTPILIVDEVTSSLDQKCENLVISRLIQTCQNRKQLLIAITHRLSWLHQVDDVWWMENGTIRQKGPHYDLQGNSSYCEFIQDTDRKTHLAIT